MGWWHVRQHCDRTDFTMCMIVFKCSDGSHLHLPGLGTDQKCSDSRPPHIWSSTPFDFGFAQRPPHPHDHHPACSARQKHSCRNGDNWDGWIVQIHRYNAHRVLYPLHCELVVAYWAVGWRKPRCEYLPGRPHPDSGSSFHAAVISGGVV